MSWHECDVDAFELRLNTISYYLHELVTNLPKFKIDLNSNKKCWNNIFRV